MCSTNHEIWFVFRARNVPGNRGVGAGSGGARWWGDLNKIGSSFRADSHRANPVNPRLQRRAGDRGSFPKIHEIDGRARSRNQTSPCAGEREIRRAEWSARLGTKRVLVQCGRSKAAWAGLDSTCTCQNCTRQTIRIEKGGGIGSLIRAPECITARPARAQATLRRPARTKVCRAPPRLQPHLWDGHQHGRVHEPHRFQFRTPVLCNFL